MTDSSHPREPSSAESPSGSRTGERIAKLLARAGIASRREVERMIAEGRVRLNDQPVTTPATVLTGLQGVTVDGNPVQAPEVARLFAFHKPSGLITAERDPAGRPTIYTALRNALPRGAPRVMPVGRLDLNTEGLLLLTNDGELKRALELPSSGVPRTYRARTFGDITQTRLEDLIEGVEIDGVRYGRIDANMERRTGRNQWVELTLTEGKNREVRRVLEHLGLQVSRLLRVSYGPFGLGDLPRGMAVEIPPAEVEKFRRTLGLAAQDPGAVRRAAKPRVPDAAPARTEGPARPVRPGKPREPGRAAEPHGHRRAAPGAKPTRPAEARQKPLRARPQADDDGKLLGRSELPPRQNAAQRPARPGAPRNATQRPRGPGKGPGPSPSGGKPRGGRRP